MNTRTYTEWRTDARAHLVERIGQDLIAIVADAADGRLAAIAVAVVGRGIRSPRCPTTVTSYIEWMATDDAHRGKGIGASEGPAAMSLRLLPVQRKPDLDTGDAAASPRPSRQTSQLPARETTGALVADRFWCDAAGMDFSGMSARDIPVPATLAEDAAGFTGPVFGLVGQPRLRIAGHGATGASGQMASISISYSYLAEPEDLNAEVNFVENIDEVRGWMRKADVDQQPDWFKAGVAAARYPMLWEAVLTTVDTNKDRALEEHLADHINYLLINTMEHRRSFGTNHVPTLDHAVSVTHAQPATLAVDGNSCPALTINTDPDVVGWAARIGDTIVALGLPRDRADHLTLELSHLPSTNPA